MTARTSWTFRVQYGLGHPIVLPGKLHSKRHLSKRRLTLLQHKIRTERRYEAIQHLNSK